jgi:hypothetical protein
MREKKAGERGRGEEEEREVSECGRKISEGVLKRFGKEMGKVEKKKKKIKIGGSFCYQDGIDAS